MTIVDLRAEAAAEARRLTDARAILRHGDIHAARSLASTAPWIAISRRRRVRRSLRGRVCLVWRVALEDASGRIVESRLMPILVDLALGARRSSIRLTLERINAAVRQRIECESDPWRAEAARVWTAFTAARLEREQGIASRRDWPAAAAQPGLFDRRVERARNADAATVAESGRAAAERLRSIAAAGAVASVPAQLLLVLVP